jgi:sugar lactone lactonase YvrE
MNRTPFALAVFFAFTVGTAGFSCSQDDAGSAAGADASADAPAAIPDASADASSDPPTGGQPSLAVVAAFDPAHFQFPEGLIVHNGSAYVGLAPLGAILKIDQAGAVSSYANVPPGLTNGSTLGLVFDAQENLYVMQTRNNPDAGATVPGVFKIPPTIDGGTVGLPFATHPQMIFPNGADLDAQGNLYVADSVAGLLFKVTPAGDVSVWSQDVELSGSPPCAAPLPFPYGANGVAVTSTEVFVTNTAKGSVVKIAFNADGSAGTVSTLVKDCAYVGLDGIWRDKDGSLLVCQNGPAGRIARVTAAGVFTPLESGGPIDSPASISIAESWNGQRTALVTSSATGAASVDGGIPKPALLRYGPLP